MNRYGKLNLRASGFPSKAELATGSKAPENVNLILIKARLTVVFAGTHDNRRPPHAGAGSIPSE